MKSAHGEDTKSSLGSALQSLPPVASAATAVLSRSRGRTRRSWAKAQRTPAWMIHLQGFRVVPFGVVPLNLGVVGAPLKEAFWEISGLGYEQVPHDQQHSG